MDFVTLYRWGRDCMDGFGQCIYGDALFLRSPEFVVYENDDDERISSYLTICLIYKRFELIDMTLKYLPENKRDAYEKFSSYIENIRNRHNFLRRISSYTNKWLQQMDSECRNYLLY